MWEQLDGPLGDQRALLQGSQNRQDRPVLEVDFLWPGRSCPSVSGPQSSSRGQVGLGSCSVGVKHLLRVRAAGGALRDKGALPQGSKNWHDHPAMDAEPPWLGGAFSGISRPKSSSRGQAVLGVEHFPSAGAANWASGRQRGASPGQPELAVPLHNGDILPMAGQSLLWCFWAAELFWRAGSAEHYSTGCSPSRGWAGQAREST